jgi:hypothetical protein
MSDGIICPVCGALMDIIKRTFWNGVMGYLYLCKPENRRIWIQVVPCEPEEDKEQ